MLTRIRNAIVTGQTLVAMPDSKIKVEIARILKEEGFIEGYEQSVDEANPIHRTLRMRLKYVGERRERKSVISGLTRISRPGRRVYTKKQDIPW
ncbi:MAG TPA: 30S ribosomal protein S8, partial [Anaerolineaceae bacterium]|nr:30S ribosomal protein S8 [Anaerolineaceae bacterium]